MTIQELIDYLNTFENKETRLVKVTRGNYGERSGYVNACLEIGDELNTGYKIPRRAMWIEEVY